MIVCPICEAFCRDYDIHKAEHDRQKKLSDRVALIAEMIGLEVD